MDEYDKAAVLGLLIKQVRSQDVVTKQTPIRDQADGLIKLAIAEQSLIRDALRVFGFDPKANNMWEDVKAAIGSTMFFSSFKIARAAVEPEASTKEEEQDKRPADDDSTDGESESNSEDGGGETGEPPRTDDGQPEVSANIKEMVVERLKAAGAAGSHTALIREHIEKSGKGSMHGKTVGMTLYRLGKEGIARRDGRIWFYAGADAPLAGEGPTSSNTEEKPNSFNKSENE